MVNIFYTKESDDETNPKNFKGPPRNSNYLKEKKKKIRKHRKYTSVPKSVSKTKKKISFAHKSTTMDEEFDVLKSYERMKAERDQLWNLMDKIELIFSDPLQVLQSIRTFKYEKMKQNGEISEKIPEFQPNKSIGTPPMSMIAEDVKNQTLEEEVYSTESNESAAERYRESLYTDKVIGEALNISKKRFDRPEKPKRPSSGTSYPHLPTVLPSPRHSYPRQHSARSNHSRNQSRSVNSSRWQERKSRLAKNRSIDNTRSKSRTIHRFPISESTAQKLELLSPRSKHAAMKFYSLHSEMTSPRSKNIPLELEQLKDYYYEADFQDIPTLKQYEKFKYYSPL